MNINGSVTPAVYEVRCPATAKWKLVRVNFMLLDTGIIPSNFGGVAALTNGLTIKVVDASDVVLLDFMEGETIKQNADFTYLAGVDAPVLDTLGGNPDMLPIRWTIAKAGNSILLHGGDAIQITVPDDLSTMNDFRAMIQGVIYTGV
jgi:hypothetical protein